MTKSVLLIFTAVAALLPSSFAKDDSELLSTNGPEIMKFLQGCRPGGLAPGLWIKDESHLGKGMALRIRSVEVRDTGEKRERVDRVTYIGGKLKHKVLLVLAEGFWEISGDRKVALFSVPGGGGFGPEVERLQRQLKDLTTDGTSNLYRMERLVRKERIYIRILQEMGEVAEKRATEMMELIVGNTNKELGLWRWPLSMMQRLPKAADLVPTRVEYLIRESDLVIESTRTYNKKGKLVNEQREEDASGYTPIGSLPEGWFDVPADAEERYPKGLFAFAKASAGMYKNECFVPIDEFNNPFFMVKNDKIMLNIGQAHEN